MACIRRKAIVPDVCAFFFFSSRRRHTRSYGDWSSDVCSSDLEPGQEQPVHTHAGADKFYLVVTGKARFILGDSVREAGPGDLILAPEGVPHGIETALERTVMLVAIAPAPRG